MKFQRVLIVLACLLLGVSTASAATVNFTADFDLSTAAYSGPTTVYSGGFSGITAGIAGIGDDVNIRYTFGGAGITGTFTGAQIEAVYPGPQNQLLWMTGTVSFLDATGAAFKSFVMPLYDTTDIYSAIANWSIGSSIVNLGPLAATIYGIAFNGHIDGGVIENLGGPLATPREYSRGSFQVFGSDLAIVTAVPVPAALPLLAVGLGALGFMGWRKKRSGAALVA